MESTSNKEFENEVKNSFAKVFGSNATSIKGETQGNDSFQIKIFKEINKKCEKKNFIMSPLSLFQILCLTANGARNKTQQEMISVLSGKSIEELNEINKKVLGEIKNFSSEVNMANAIFSKFDPLESFKKCCELYDAPMEKLVDAQQINEWCNEQTYGRIPKIIDESTELGVMALINAIYFKEEWSEQFSENDTQKSDFKNYGITPKKVDMMWRQSKYEYYESEGMKAVKLYYDIPCFYTLVILPPENMNINEFINSLNSEKLEKIISNMDQVKVDLKLPKFEVNFETQLSEFLINLGMPTPFSNGADFSNMNKEGGIQIDQVYHAAFLKVTEKGAEAACLSNVHMKLGACPGREPEKIYEMHVDRPFLFLISNEELLPKGNEIIFMAKIESL